MDESNEQKSQLGNYITELIEAQELMLLNQCDGVVAFSDIDACLLRERLPNLKTWVSPFPIPSDVSIAAVPQEFCGDFSFIGSPDHYPNRQALEWLLSDIFPGILRVLPNARLRVIGRWTTRSSTALTAPM